MCVFECVSYVRVCVWFVCVLCLPLRVESVCVSRPRFRKPRCIINTHAPRGKMIYTRNVSPSVAAAPRNALCRYDMVIYSIFLRSYSIDTGCVQQTVKQPFFLCLVPM